jgi:hypothetical protein
MEMDDDAITETPLDDIDALELEAAEQRARGTPLYVTEEAIDRNPWAAVMLDLPNDASKELLERVSETAFDLMSAADQQQLSLGDTPLGDKWRELAQDAELSWETARLALDRMPAQHTENMQTPQWKQFDDDWHMIVDGEAVAVLIWQNHPQPFQELKWLSHILTDNLPEHGWDNVDFKTLEHAQYTLEQWWHHARHGEAYEPAAQDNAPSFTEQDLYRDPWAAVYRPIPDDADQTLLELAQLAARRCQGAVAPGLESVPPENRLFTPAELGRDATPKENFERATERLSEIEERIDRERARAAWGAPEFSRETFMADGWTAVYLKISENADPALLTDARDWISALLRYAGSENAFARPLITLPEGAAEPLSAATERLAELETRLESLPQASPGQETPAMAPEQSTAPALPPVRERSITAAVSALFQSAENFVSGLFESLADMISASPPLTLEQAEGMARAEAERAQQARAWQYAGRAAAADDERRELSEQSRIGDGNVPEETLTPDERQSHSRGRGR